MALHVTLATWNGAKVAWMREALGELPLPVRHLEPGEVEDVDETGATCEANAWLKVRAVPDRAQEVVLAEDSGLFVDALDGRPGTHTARWAPGSDDDRARRLLRALTGLPPGRRGARFVSAVAIRFPGGGEATRVGILEGRIRSEPGPLGSGYGGVFEGIDGRLLADRAGVGAHRLGALAAASEVIAAWRRETR